MNSQNTTIGTKVPFLGDVHVFYLDVDIWSGKTKLDPQDIKLGQGGELPPSQLVGSLGSKNLVNQNLLKPFEKLKQRAVRALQRKGVRFMGGYALPNKYALEIKNYLDNVKMEFDTEYQTFISTLENKVEEWVESLPSEYAEAVSNVKLDPTKIADRFKFDPQCYQIQPGQAGEADLSRKAQSLSDELIKDVVKEAEKLYNDYIFGKDSISINTKGTLVALKEKIEGLAFLNSNFGNLVALLESAIQQYASNTGRIVVGAPKDKIANAVLILSSPSRIEQYGQAIANGTVALPTSTQEVDLLASAEIADEEVTETTPVTTETAPLTTAPIETVTVQEAEVVTKAKPSQEEVFAELDAAFADLFGEEASNEADNKESQKEPVKQQEPETSQSIQTAWF